MAGNELGLLKPAIPSWKEQLVRKTLQNVRSRGHTYVDLRDNGKRYFFFCALCLTPCYSDTVLLDHLRGNLHNQRYSAAKITLMGPNPWPFDDGMFFFKNYDEQEMEISSRVNSRRNLLDDHEFVDDLALVVHDSAINVADDGVSMADCLEGETRGNDSVGIEELVIPGVLCKEAVSDLHVKLMGYGRLSARFVEKDDGVCMDLQRLWCEWLGKKGDETNSRIPTMDFAIVTFGYFYDLGKQSLLEGVKTLLLTSVEGEKDGGSVKRRKKSLSDTDVAGETIKCYSSGEDSRGLNSACSALLLHQYDYQLVKSKIMSSKSLRRELRKQQRVASEKTCEICRQKMLPGRDVATLLNLKTGRLACSSRNVHGAFHVFHTSCLLHWILLCEFEMFKNTQESPKPKSRRRGKTKVNQQGEQSAKSSGRKRNQSRKDCDAGTLCERICSVFCPECQGTGLEIEGAELENPCFHLSQLFKYKIKLSDAHRAWMKSPERLENCSTGFAFHVQIDDAQEKVVPLKLLNFYRASEEKYFDVSG